MRTGDLGHRDADGFLYLHARVDDVINRGGEKVLPREVEEAIGADPMVASVAVVGRDDPELGQVPVAYVVLRAAAGDDGGDHAASRLEAAETADRIRKALERDLVRAKRPVSLSVVERMPAGPTGKVKRRLLGSPEAPVRLHLRPAVTTVESPLSPARPLRGTRKRLDHIDAMRPVKQAGVVSTHTLLFFAPVAAGLTVGASLQLLHVTREAFLFVSACMLAYSVRDLPGIDHRTFWRRRFALVAVPYLCWTVIYFLVGLPSEHGTPRADTIHLLYLFGTGYYQLYYLLVLLEFYALFPLLLVLLRKTAGHHGLVLLVSGLVQMVLVSVHALGPAAVVDAGLLGHPRGHLVSVLSGGRHGRRHAPRRVPRLALRARAAHCGRHAGGGRRGRGLVLPGSRSRAVVARLELPIPSSRS